MTALHTIALISDIHGNYPALKSVLDEIKNLNIKNIICLGDIAGYYPYINECIETIRSITDCVIMGNHDYYLAYNKNCPRSNSANKCLNYQKTVITKDNLLWLKTLAQYGIFNGINCVHGSWNNFLDEYLQPDFLKDKKFEQKFLASGHTHIPIIKKFNDFIYCNPGSVGQPRDKNNKASFAVFDGNDFKIIRVDYDIECTQLKMKECGFDEYFYKNLQFGLKIGAKTEGICL